MGNILIQTVCYGLPLGATLAIILALLSQGVAIKWGQKTESVSFYGPMVVVFVGMLWDIWSGHGYAPLLGGIF